MENKLIMLNDSYCPFRLLGAGKDGLKTIGLLTLKALGKLVADNILFSFLVFFFSFFKRK